MDEPAQRKFMEVIRHIQQRVEEGSLKPGDQLPTEREIARQLKISRGSVRIGMGYLTGMGIAKARPGVGAFLADSAEHGQTASFRMAGVLRCADFRQMLEARLILEGAAAALAAERCRAEHLRELAEEVAEMYAAMDCAEQFAVHEKRFHRVIAEASGNPVLSASVGAIADEAISAPQVTSRSEQHRRHAADMYREIYKAIRQRKPDESRRWMEAVLSPRSSVAAISLEAVSGITK